MYLIGKQDWAGMSSLRVTKIPHSSLLTSSKNNNIETSASGGVSDVSMDDEIYKENNHVNFNPLQKKKYLYCVKSVQIRSLFWSVLSCIRTEYGDFIRKYLYPVRIQQNTDQIKLRIWTLFR